MVPRAFDSIRDGRLLFRQEIRHTKLNSSETFPWNNEDILDMLNFMDDFIDDQLDTFFMNPRRYANIGAADGELAFYLESLGNSCDIFDNRKNNLNALIGAERLCSTLQSSTKIFNLDIKTSLELPSYYDFIFLIDFMSLIRDPFTSLENLAMHCKYLFISTKVIQTVSRNFGSASIPIAQIADDPDPVYGLKRYWVLNESGIEQLVNRTGWKIIGSRTLPTTEISLLGELGNQHRIIVLLKSEISKEDSIEIRIPEILSKKNSFLSVRELFIFLSRSIKEERLGGEFLSTVRQLLTMCITPPLEITFLKNSITVHYQAGETIHFDGEEWYHVRP